MHLILATRVVADNGNGPGAGLGLLVFLVLLVACIFLFRSMSGRIKRLPASFDAAAPSAVSVEAKSSGEGDDTQSPT